MPNKDPTLWAIVIAWLLENGSAIYGAALALAIAFLRITYHGGRGQRRLIESLLCGLITLAVATGVRLLGIAEDATPFIGGMVGLLGVDTLRSAAERRIDARANQIND
ncbi:Phage holin family (Lysis protein S) [compost metagenome]